VLWTQTVEELFVLVALRWKPGAKVLSRTGAVYKGRGHIRDVRFIQRLKLGANGRALDRLETLERDRSIATSRILAFSNTT